MLRLTRQRESRWIELEGLGVRIQVRPVTTAIAATVRAEAQKRAAALWADAEKQKEAGFDPDPTGANITNPHWRAGLVNQLHAELLLRYAAEAWEGVVGEDGAALPIDAASAMAFAEHDGAAQAFLKAMYAEEDAAAAEGNASAPFSPGAGEGGAITAPAASPGAAQPVH